MDFLKELEWRGMLYDVIFGIEEVFKVGKVVGYIGFDFIVFLLIIGNYVQLMLLILFQCFGYQLVVFMGGVMGWIGDFFGKDKECELKFYDELDNNLQYQVWQMEKFINFIEGDNKVILVNNLDFYKDMNILDFLCDVGKILIVNYMSFKEFVKKCLEIGLFFIEFSY